MRKPTIYSVEFNCNQALVAAQNIQQARRFSREYFGDMNQPIVSRATKKDIAWVQQMGGRILEADKKRP